MSLANLLRYNFRVVKIEHAFRGILTITSLLVIVLLMAASNWAPLNRLLHSSQTAQNSGDISTASILFAHAAKYSPSKFELIEKAGLLARKAGDSASARSYLLQVQESSLLSPAGLIVLGDISYEAGLADEAINYWEAANELEKNEETYAKLVRAYRQTGDWEQVIHAQKELVNLNQYNAAANYQIGLMLAASDPNSSLAYLSLAGELDKSLKKVTQPLARSLRSAANRGDPAYPFMIAGQELAAIDEWELAQLAFTNAARLDI